MQINKVLLYFNLLKCTPSKYFEPTNKELFVSMSIFISFIEHPDLKANAQSRQSKPSPSSGITI